MLGVDEHQPAVLSTRAVDRSACMSATTVVSAGDTMHSPLNCLPGAGWSPLNFRASRKFPFEAAKQADIDDSQSLRDRKGPRSTAGVVLHQSHGRAIVVSIGKLYMVCSTPFG